jgi:hypothetical protein
MDKRVIEGPERYELSPEMQAHTERMTDEADADIEELRISMRWRNAQLAVVRKAAALFGMPYQTYMKQAAFRQAVVDLQAAEVLSSDKSAAPARQRKGDAEPRASRKNRVKG